MRTNRRRRASLLWLAWLLIAGLPAAAADQSDPPAQQPAVVDGSDEEPRRFQPNAYAGMKIGNQRIIGQFGFLGPIVQNEQSLLFMDLRGRVDDTVSGEGNFGLGGRHIFGQRRFVGGAYGYFDILRSAQHNTFVQGTLGLELSSEFWMARSNAYIPEDRDQVIRYTGGPTGPQIVNNSIQIVSGLGKAVTERPMLGFDVEVGRRIPLFGNDLWLHAAYFRFSGSGLSTIEGPRLRAEYAIDLGSFVPNASLAVGGEWLNDDVRGNHGYGTFEFRYAFGGDRSRGWRPRGNVHWTDRRMVGRVVRDVDILTGTLLTGVDQFSETGLDPTTGAEYGAVVTVAEGADPMGAGTLDDPVHITGAAAIAEAGGIIILSRQNGDIVVDPGSPSAPLVLDTNHDDLTVVGGGGFIDVASFEGDIFRLAIPGGNPTLRRTDPGSLIDVDGASNVQLRNLKLEGGGIAFSGARGATFVQEVEILNSLGDGLEIGAGSTGSFEFDRVQITDPAGRGIYVGATPADLSFNQVGVRGSGDAGVFLDGTLGSASFTRLGVDTTGNAAVGFLARDAVEINVLEEPVLTTSGLINFPTSTIQAGSGGAIDIQHATGETLLGMNWSTLESLGAETGIDLRGVTGNFFVDFSTLDGSGASATSKAVSIADSTADIEFLTILDIDRVGTGIDVTGLDCVDTDCTNGLGLFSISSFDEIGGSAIDIRDSSATLQLGDVDAFGERVGFVDILDSGGDAIVLSRVSGDVIVVGDVNFSEVTSNRALGASLEGGTLLLRDFLVVGAGGGANLAPGEDAAAISISGASAFEARKLLVFEIEDAVVPDTIGLLVEDTTEIVNILTSTGGLGSDFFDIEGDAVVIRNAPGTQTDDFSVGLDNFDISFVRGDGIVLEFAAGQASAGTPPPVEDPPLPVPQNQIAIRRILIDSVTGDGLVVRAKADPATTPGAHGLLIDIDNMGVIDTLGDAIVAEVSNGFAVDLQVTDNVVQYDDEFFDFDADGEYSPEEQALVAMSGPGNGIRIDVAPAGQPLDFDMNPVSDVNDIDIRVQRNSISGLTGAGILLRDSPDAPATGRATALIDANTITLTDGRGIELASGASLDLHATLRDNILIDTPGIRATSVDATSVLKVDLDTNAFTLQTAVTPPTFEFVESATGATLDLFCEDPACPMQLMSVGDFTTLLNLGGNSVDSSPVVDADVVFTPTGIFGVEDDPADFRRAEEVAP